MNIDETELLVCALHKPEHLDEVWAEFKPHIQDRKVVVLLEAAWKYYKITKGMLTREKLQEIIAEASPEVQADYIAMFDDVTSRRCSGERCEEDFKWKVAKFQKAYRELEIGKALAASMETLTTGYTHNGALFKGPEAAVRVFADLSSRTTFNDTQVLDCRSSIFGDLTERNYAEKKMGGKPIFTGFEELDKHTLGVLKSNLVLVAAYAGECKSFSLLNMAHSAQVQQGLNVAVATGEMSTDEYRSRYLSRHSVHIDMQRGVKTKHIERGILSPEEEKQLFGTVVPDLVENPDYGKLYIWQFNRKESIDSLMRRCMALPVQIDVLVVDYLSLLTPVQRRAQRWEEANDIIKDAKQAAISAYNGDGVVLYSGFQTKRAAWEQAIATGRYTKSAFAESAEAERQADLAFWLLDESYKGGEYADSLTAGVMKYRHGSTDLSEFWFKKDLDYALLRTSGGVERNAHTG